MQAKAEKNPKIEFIWNMSGRYFRSGRKAR
jgi:hypothetical protein